MTLNIFKECHTGYSNLKIYSPIKFCCGHIFQWYKKLRSFKSHVGYKILRSHSPEEFFIALAIGLLLKSNTGTSTNQKSAALDCDVASFITWHTCSFDLLSRKQVHGYLLIVAWLCFYQTRSAWSMDQGSNRKHSAVHNFASTVTKFCVMWEGQALPHDTKFSNCRQESDFYLILDPWIKLIWFDKSRARWWQMAT